MNYTDAVKFVHSRLRFGVRPGLGNIRRMLSLCGNPQDGMRFVHVAGTNGKGSVCTMLSGIFRASGRRTGLYLSPYVTDFRERIQVDGEMIPKKAFAGIIARLLPIVERLDKENTVITEFELLTAAAFIYYRDVDCDIVVLETGLGGRFDATNVIASPVCSVITRIDYDHTAVLGDTIEMIAGEKCGIIKPGCPVVSYPDQYQGAADTIEESAARSGSRLILPDRPETVSSGVGGTVLRYKGMMLHIPLVGAHQTLNAVTAAETALAAGASADEIERGIASVRFPARVEVLSERPVTILDGAHNPNGMSALRDTLDLIVGCKRPTLVIGMLADKDYEHALGIIAPICAHIVTVRVPNPRTLTAADLAKTAKKYCADSVCARSYAQALRVAGEKAGGDPVVICGSLYLASAIRPKAIDFALNR
jgi:dihydrofolate synthase/folylpolyglutamate synthase